MEFKAYPIKFNDIFITKVWGGNKLSTILNKNIKDNTKVWGESFEISSLPENPSTIKNGIYKGNDFLEILNKFPEQISGTNYNSFNKTRLRRSPNIMPFTKIRREDYYHRK